MVDPRVTLMGRLVPVEEDKVNNNNTWNACNWFLSTLQGFTRAVYAFFPPAMDGRPRPALTCFLILFLLMLPLSLSLSLSMLLFVSMFVVASHSIGY